MTYAEAVAWHLKQAGKLAQRSAVAYDQHIQQAALNRKWAWREARGLLDDFR